MKKLFSLFCSALLLFGGCWLSQENNENDPTDPVAVESTDFDAVMLQMHEAYQEEILSQLPAITISEKYEQTMELSGEITPPTAATETITFSVNSESKSDISDPSNPISESQIHLSGEMKGDEPRSGNLNVHFKIIDQMMMASLTDLKVIMNGEELPLAMMVGPYLNKWYGATFDEINAMINQYGGQDLFDLQNSFKAPQEMMETMRLRFEAALQEVHFWQLEETLDPTENMLRYRVSLNQEKAKQGMIALREFFADPTGNMGPKSTVLEQVRQDVETQFTEKNPQFSGVLSVNTGNVRFFSLEGTLAMNGQEQEVLLLRGEDTLKVQIQKPETTNTKSQDEDEEAVDVEKPMISSEPQSISFIKEGENYELVADEQTILRGTWTEDSITGTAFEENPAEGEAARTVATFDLRKTGEHTYQGQLLLPEENIEVTLKNFQWSEEGDISLSASARQNDQSVFSATLTSDVTEIENVSIEKPENIAPFQDLLGLLGFTGMGSIPNSPEGDVGFEIDPFDPNAGGAEFDPALLERVDPNTLPIPPQQ